MRRYMTLETMAALNDDPSSDRRVTMRGAVGQTDVMPLTPDYRTGRCRRERGADFGALHLSRPNGRVTRARRDVRPSDHRDKK
jgi:hypothetical protein